MMESVESCVPPGFRFHPTDEELVGYYLKKKVASQKIDLDVMREIDLYRIEPWDLQERCRIGYEEQNEWYFFSHKDKKYPTGTRTNRATMAGFWKATGRDKAVYDKTKLIGMRKTLVFYKGRAPNGQKSDWIMHEYRLESDENGPPQDEGWVVCRAFKKKTNGQTKAMDRWDSSYLLEEASGVDPIELIARQPNHHHHHHHQSYNVTRNNYTCKQEIEVDTLIHSSDPLFIQQLPQLESPSLVLTKWPSSSDNKNSNEEDDPTTKKVTTDWRALDKFVASQLSQEDSFETPKYNSSDISSMLLLQNTATRDEADESNRLSLSPFFNTRTSSDCDIGICVFDR
ncbi:hypothetical protein K1719_036778 [Acacia pycnantha]|nr:hypothetical protein K1719_036778 [Acacia pycnantha]